MRSGENSESVATAPATMLVAAAVCGLMAAAALVTIIGQMGLDRQTATAVLSGVCFLALVGIAMTLRTSQSDEHLFAGESLTPLAGGFALASIFGWAATALLPGTLYTHGFDGLLPFAAVASGFVLLITLVGPALSRAGVTTLPALIGLRFGRAGRALTLVIAVVSSFGLIAVQFGVGVQWAAHAFGFPLLPTSLVAGTLVLLIVLPGGLRSVAWSSSAVAFLSLAAVTGGMGVLTFARGSGPIPQLGYGSMLQEIGPAEEQLIEAGLVDFGVFKPFLKSFLAVDTWNWLLVSLSLMAAMAALPVLVQGTRVMRGPAGIRRGLAWASLFVALFLAAIPAIAALARLDVYRTVAAGPALADLPQWVQAASGHDAVRVHGVSLALMGQAAAAVREGMNTPDAVAASLATRDRSLAAAWDRLDGSVQEAIIGAASTAPPDSSPLADRWAHLASAVLPVAAAATGHEADSPINLADLAVRPDLLLLEWPSAAGLSAALSAIVTAALLMAALAAVSWLTVTSAAMLAHDGVAVMTGAEASPRAQVSGQRLAAVALMVAGAVVTSVAAIPLDVTLAGSLTLCAAGLFPALVLAMWSRHVTPLAGVAAIVAGLSVALYYFVGTAFFSVPFYELWHLLSSGGPEAYQDFSELRDVWRAADEEMREPAYADLAARAGGGLWSPGLANWFGIAPAASAIVAIPVALGLAWIVSRIMRRPGSHI